MSKLISELLGFLLRAFLLAFMLFYMSFAVFYGVRLALKDVEPIHVNIADNIIKDSTFNSSPEQPGLVVGGGE